MEEARRFLRYIVPGLVFIIQVMASLLVINYEAFARILAKINNAGTVLGIFIASGGLGYLFSNAYHWVYWSWPYQGKFAIEHKKVIQSLGSKIRICEPCGTPKKIKNLKKRQCWVIINVYWHNRLKKSKGMEGANKKNDQISDITHGLGGTVIATFVAALTCVFLALSPVVEFNGKYAWWLVPVWLFFIVPAVGQFWRSHKVFQSMANSTFANEINDEYQKKSRTTVTVYFSD